MDNTFIYLIAAVLVSILFLSLYFLLKNKTASKNEDEPQTKVNESITHSIQADVEITPPSNPIPTIEEEKITPSDVVQKVEKTKKASHKYEVEDDLPEPISKLNINISSKTERQLIKKLEAFEKNKGFLKKDVNLNNLAKQFDTNTKYLSEIIKSYKNKNFNHYLNELRINYLIDQLNTNDKVLNTKVSYLASDFGFSSHSSFSTLFTQYMGQSPSEYIKQLKDQKKQA